MSTKRARTLAAAAVLAAALCAAPVPSGAAGLVAPVDTARTSPPDTVGRPAAMDTLRSNPIPDSLRVRLPGPAADSSRALPRDAVWRMDDLKRILSSETGGGGKEYRQRKSGRVAMLYSLAFPGLGQIYNEKPLKAAIAMGVETYYVLQIAQNRRLREREKDIRDRYPVGTYQWKFHDAWVTEYWDKSVDWIWWSAGAVVVVLIDAYVDAHLDDMRFKVEPTASRGGVGVQCVVRL